MYSPGYRSTKSFVWGRVWGGEPDLAFPGVLPAAQPALPALPKAWAASLAHWQAGVTQPDRGWGLRGPKFTCLEGFVLGAQVINNKTKGKKGKPNRTQGHSLGM